MDAQHQNKLHLRLYARQRRLRRDTRQAALLLVGALALAVVWPLLEGYSFWGNTYRTYTWVMLAVLVPGCGILLHGIWQGLRQLGRIKRDLSDGEIVQVSGPVQDKKSRVAENPTDSTYHIMLHGEWFAVDFALYDQAEKGQPLSIWVGQHSRSAVN